MKQINIRLDEELIKQVKRVCINNGMTLQGAVMIALKDWLDNQNNKT